MTDNEVLIDGKYRLLQLSGSGGMANVYEARDAINGRVVAVKILRRENQNNLEDNIRFRNEISIIKTLSHPNIIKYFDNGTYEGLPYLVTEFIRSKDLKKIVDFKGFFSIKEAVIYMNQLLDAVSYLHSLHIVHRDIKSSNIFILSDGTVKLGDFGISIRLDSDANINEVRRIPGTAQYLAPELVKGHKPTYQSDIYSLGILFYEMLVGKVPFNGSDTNEIASMQVKFNIPSVRKIYPSYPQELDEIIGKATAKSLNKRYKTCLQFKHDLMAFDSTFNSKEKAKPNKEIKRTFRRSNKK